MLEMLNEYFIGHKVCHPPFMNVEPVRCFFTTALLGNVSIMNIAVIKQLVCGISVRDILKVVNMFYNGSSKFITKSSFDFYFQMLVQSSVRGRWRSEELSVQYMVL